jgi:hypothetical protein
LAVLASARAGTRDRDKAWDAAIAQAKAHGGQETKLDKSASYVFQRDDGSYVTLTRMYAGGKRAACLVSKTQNASVCFDWDTGKISYAERKDVASPWIQKKVPVEDPDEDKPSLLAQFLNSFADILGYLGKYRCCDRAGNLIFYN